MNSLILSGGYGIKISVKNMRTDSHLHITGGKNSFHDEPTTYSFRPRRIPYDSIIIGGHSDYISLQAFQWLSRNKIPVFILSWDGSLTTSILPPMPVKADLRVAQIDSYRNPDRRFTVAQAIVRAKIQRNFDVLRWLGEHYDIDRQVREAKREAIPFPRAGTIDELRVTEARVAQKYWEAIQPVVPDTFCFQSRLIRGGRARNAVDPVNLVLNYSYSVIQGLVRRALNSVGLEFDLVDSRVHWSADKGVGCA